MSVGVSEVAAGIDFRKFTDGHSGNSVPLELNDEVAVILGAKIVELSMVLYGKDTLPAMVNVVTSVAMYSVIVLARLVQLSCDLEEDEVTVPPLIVEFDG